jgi:RNA polymerase sigma-70 factor (ECF subfamily)
MDVLAPDVVSVADGGGKAQGAARRPIVGADKVARYVLGGLAKAGGGVAAIPTWVNGEPGIRMELDGQLVGVVSFAIENGLITRVFAIANPEKLGRIDEEAAVSR